LQLLLDLKTRKSVEGLYHFAVAGLMVAIAMVISSPFAAHQL